MNGCHSMDPRNSSNLQSASCTYSDVCECSSKWSFTDRVTDIGGRPSGPFDVDEVSWMFLWAHWTSGGNGGSGSRPRRRSNTGDSSSSSGSSNSSSSNGTS